MFAPFLYVAAWRIPLTNMRTTTRSAVTHLKGRQLQTANPFGVSHSRHSSLDLTEPKRSKHSHFWVVLVWVVFCFGTNQSEWSHRHSSLPSSESASEFGNPQGQWQLLTFTQLHKPSHTQGPGNSMTCHVKNVHRRGKMPRFGKRNGKHHLAQKKGLCLSELTCCW